MHTERNCRRQFQFDENVRKFTQMDRKYVGKGKIAHYEQLLLSQWFQKTSNADT